ncbi:MAG TPA: PPC domain-containing protein [Planctomycetota bacterium]|nr:PPC domain-containing protein [Planctomycetota bacterium]
MNSALPEFIQRGAELEVNMAGENLDGISRVDVHGGEGLSISVVPDTTPPEKRDKKTFGKNVKLKIHAAPNATAGDRELRVVGPGGVSNPIAFNIGLYPVVLEKEPNNTFDQAQKIDLPAVIAGAIDGAGDVDVYTFTAKKSESIVFEVQASRVGSKLDSSLRIFDAKGKLVARDEDTNDLDSLIPFHAPEDGDYFLQIRDLRYQGGKEYTYRIVAGHTPYIESIFPSGGKRGTTVNVEPRGFNLEGLPQFPVVIDSNAPLGAMRVHAQTAAGTSNDVNFDVSEWAEFNEAEPNDTPAAANPVKVPCVVNGRIGAPKDTDCFRFHVKKGQRFSFDAVTARIGSPLDPQLILYNAKGEFIQQEDANGKFERAFDADGEFVVAVRDLNERGGPEFQYRLYIQEPMPAPSFVVKFTPDRVRLHRGGHVKLWCDVTREAGFAPDIKIAFENLPKGVTSEPYVASTKTPNSGLLILSAADDAELGAVPLQLKAAGMVKDKEVSRAAEAQFNKRSVRSAYVSVLDAAPFTIGPAKELTKEDREKYAKERVELEAAVNAQTPELDAAQAKWESGEAVKYSWTTLEPIEFKSKSGATLKKLDDGSILASGKNDATDLYTFTARTSLAGITAIRLEALTDSSLADGGPGRAPNGNFVLKVFSLALAGEDGKNPAPVKFVKASQDFAQASFSAMQAIDGSKIGWAVSPEFGKSHSALFEPEKPFCDSKVKTLSFTLDCTSQYPQHTLGRVRLSATTVPKPALDGAPLPDSIRQIVFVDKEKRSDEQKKALAAYYRSISPELAAKRERLAQIVHLDTYVFPPVAARNESVSLNVEVKRKAGFKGDIKVNITGFNTGSKEGDEQPANLNLDITPATLRGEQVHGAVVIKPKFNCPTGTRDIVLFAEAKMDGETITQFSERIPLTVKEKK